MSLTVGVVDPNDISSLATAPGDFSTVNEEGELERLTSAGRLLKIVLKCGNSDNYVHYQTS